MSGPVDHVGHARATARRLRAVSRELRKAASLGHEPSSSLVLCGDVLMYRVLRLRPSMAREQTKRVVLTGAVAVHYRRNRGDLHTLREVWLDETYRLPFDLQPRIVVDLGANIGLTSLWYGSRYDLEHLVAVEASASNVEVLHKNLAPANATVIHAAIGSDDGHAHFADSAQSHLGHVSAAGRRVRQVSMHTVLEALAPGTTVDLLKVDIEGAEEQLFSGDLSWMGRVRSIIIEIHPPLADRDAIVERVRLQGFRYLPAGSVWPESMDAFVRVDQEQG